ncbi:hypothetical protein BV22DRAFT_1031379 [Leucogyrophana mollusca]|uniref:Uncharacterized protein n=1 Tax=Leucogyrophana mollusca TaxID=85980 RepID=A0ACB8BPC7_9AGAM|nr:hypothetical protein BV22DRAFT_1031379 [Leucogyrophana mollusca]
MKFSFSKHEVEKADLSDEQGHVVYRIQTQNHLFSHDKTTITKLLPSPSVLAEIEWRNIGATVLRFSGNEVKTKEFMPSKKDGRIRLVTGPDGRLYKWRLGMDECIFGVVDECDLTTELASFNEPGGIFHKEDHYLQVSPRALHMLDFIVMTFIALERTRERANHREEAHEAVEGMERAERTHEILDHDF